MGRGRTVKAVATEVSAKSKESSGDGMVLQSCPKFWSKGARLLYFQLDHLLYVVCLPEEYNLGFPSAEDSL